MNSVSQHQAELAPAFLSPIARSSRSWGSVLVIDFRGAGNSADYRAHGWSGQEPDAIWSIGRESGLRLPPLTGAETLVVDLDVEACNFGSTILAQVFRIRANGQLLGGVRVVGRAVLRFRIPPAAMKEGEPITLTFEHPNFVRLDLLGGKDDRPLAFRFRTLTAYSDTLSHVLNQGLDDAARLAVCEVFPAAPDLVQQAAAYPTEMYDFKAGGAKRDCLRDGWMIGEDAQLWASGIVSRIDLPLPSSPGRHRLRVSIAPLTVRELLPRQLITIVAQDCVVGQFRINSDTVLSLCLPPELLVGSSELRLAFLAPLALSMAEFGGGEEQRLGFLLDALAIDSVPPHLAALADLRGDDAEELPALARSDRYLDTPLDNIPNEIKQDFGVAQDVLLKEFESLGDNCAFGLAQRKGGVEVLGLLRFANTPLKKLVAALDDDFKAASDPSEMAVRLRAEGNPPEYMLWLDRYGIRWHTQILEPDASAETVFEQQTMKVGYLRRKFLEGIRAGRKIYSLARVDAIQAQKVMPAWGARSKYEFVRENPRIAEVLPVLLHLNRTAKNTLLFFVTGNLRGRRSGSVEMIAPGLLIGYLGRPYISDAADAHDHVEWLRVIANAWIVEHSANAAFRGVDNVLDRLAEREPAQAEIVPFATKKPSTVRSPKPGSLRDLALTFESLGENCEFGLAQRKCDAEPLGIFRFTSAPQDKLLKALSENFKGMGDADKIEVQVSDNGQEYMVLDKKYGFLSHAWVLVGEKSPEEVYAREVKRLPFLVRKLREDLRRGEKIFVYHAMRPLTLTQAKRLAGALRHFGPTTLLWVELADEEHPAGTVEFVTAGLLKGYIDRFAPGENAHDFTLDSWLPIMNAAYALWASSPE